MAEVGQGEQKESGRKDQYSFAAKPYWQKLLVLSGGIIFNLIFAYFAFILLFMTGIPKTPILFPDETKAIIGKIQEGSPAQKYNLKVHDQIIAINQIQTPNLVSFLQEIVKHPNKNITLTIIRDGKEEQINLTTGSRQQKLRTIGTLGIEPELGELKELEKQPFMQSVKLGIAATNKCIALTFNAFKSMFQERNFESVGGPLLVISETIKGIEKGFKIFLIMLALISVNLAIFNLIPLPIADGGQILFTTIEAIIRRQLPEKVKLTIHYISWIGVLVLALYLSFKDILRIFFKK